MPLTRINFRRRFWPDAMVKEEWGAFKSFARNSAQANAWNLAPHFALSVVAKVFPSSQRLPSPRERSLSLPRSRFQNHATSPSTRRPSGYPAGVAQRPGREVHRACENKVSPAEHHRKRAEWSSAPGIAGLQVTEQPSRDCPVQRHPVSARFLQTRRPRSLRSVHRVSCQVPRRTCSAFRPV